jgi:hypothetical protein
MNAQETILAPDLAMIRQHLAAWAAPYIGTEFDDGLCEIAFTAPGGAAPDRARMFPLDDLDAPASFAAQENARGANIYIGAALRAPDANPHKRGSTIDFYAAAFAGCEADEDADAVAERIEGAGLKGAIRVRTGEHPEKRVHHWLPLRELCDDPDAYTEALGALVAHVGADAKVRDSARVLRLGGTVNWITDPAKQAKGYVDELTAVITEDAPAADLDRLARLDPIPGWKPAHKGGKGGNGGPSEIARNAAGLVTDGREAFWRQIVIAELASYHRKTGADPTAEEIFAAAYPRFCSETEGDDRWTSERGQRELRKRVQNTLRRLRLGHLARHGLYSIETGAGREEAERVQRERDQTRLDRADPTPLIRDMPEAGPYPVAALGPLREPAEAIAAATEAPVAMCAASVLASAALAAQGHRDAETLNGTAPASLFLLTVAESGERKSTADRLAMRGVRDFEADLRTDHDIARDLWRDAHEVYRATRAKIVGDKKADAAAKRADLQALGPEPPAPIKPHIVASAPTIEGIVKHLPELRASLGIMTEEGGALIGGHSMKAENRLATCASFSAMWDGQPLDRWRAGDGVEAYTGRRFSAHILVQPVAAEALLSDPMANGQGLLARFLTCRPASRIGTRLRMERDAQADAAIARFAARIRSLLSRDLPLADGKRNELAPPVLPMSREARDVLTAFAREVEKAQAPGGPFEDARAFASKTAEHAARLAAVLTIYADPDAPEVAGETMAGATEIATFYANEAARLADAAIVPPEVADAERMRLWLLRSWGEPFISARAAAQRGPFKVTDRARKALRKLESHGWLIEANGAEVEGKPRREAWRIVREVQS